MTLNFIKKINQIGQFEFIFKIYEVIISKEVTNEIYLNNNEKHLILEFLIKFPFEEYNKISSDNNIYNFLCNYFNDKSIELNDFYETSEEIIGTFKIFNFLNKKEGFKNKEFFKNSEKNFINFKNSIDKNEISCNSLIKLNEIIKTPNFKYKIEYFKFDEIQYNNFIQNIEANYKYLEEQRKKLDICSEYLNKIGNNTDIKFTVKIEAKKKDLKQKSFANFQKSMKEELFNENINKIYKRAQKYENMINSKLKIINVYIKGLENRMEGEEANIKYLENKIKKLKNIVSEETLKKINKDELKEFLSIFSSENELKEEINKLKKYFGINSDTNIIEKYLSLEYKRLKIFETLINFINVIIQFNLVKTDFFDKLNELKEAISKLDIENNFDEKLLDENHKKVDEFIITFENIVPKLKLKFNPIDFISFIVNIFNVNSLLPFLFDITSDDLAGITNSISSNYDIYALINEYQRVHVVIDELKQKSGIKRDEKEKIGILSDVNFFTCITDVIKENLNGKTIEEFKIILENCAKNKSKLEDLFGNAKGITKKKEDIKDIIKESKFIIYRDDETNSYVHSKYICSCEFKNNSKKIFLKDLILLQHLAALSQIHEKNDESKPLDIFIGLVENIKDFISIIEKITYKGFPEQFNYNIYVKDGKIKCNDSNVKSKKDKKITEQKDDLLKLLNNINKNQEKAYKNTQFLKFFYGQQLTIFNRYLKFKDQSLKNEVSNLIYYIIGNKYKSEPDNFMYSSKFSSESEDFSNNDINYKKIKIKRKDNNIRICEKKSIARLKLNYMNNFEDIAIGINNISSRNKIPPKNDEIMRMKTFETLPFLEEGNEKELEKIMEEMYYNIEKYLEEIMKINYITQEEIFKSSIIKNKYYEDHKGFFIKNCGNNIYEKILEFYHNLVGNTPPRYSLLLCNEETTLEELISFIYLATFCQYHSLFIIAKPDKLNIDIIYEMEDILEKINAEKSSSIKSYILFLFEDSGKSEIGNELLKICKEADEFFNNKKNKSLKKKIINNELEINNNFKNVQIISSSKAGLGKSHYILKECKNNNETYIPFPIGGEVKRQTIMRRLKELKIKKDNKSKYGLHLDFSDTRQLELFEDFIFSFLIQKFYSNNENIFCYEDNINIYIEIPNGFFNFMDKFRLFKKFNIKNIDILPKLELNENKFNDFEDMKNDKIMGLKSLFDIQKKNEQLNHYYLYQSDYQMVFNYLKYLDEIGRKNLFFYNINEKTKGFIKNYIDSKFIDEKEGSELLNKYFNQNDKSYHQINIYIKVLADQLRKFSINHYLMIENTLKPKIRKDIINSFMDLTEYFTVSAFNKILSEQTSSIIINSDDKYFDENEAIEKANEKLLNEEQIINFNQLNDKAFIFINNDGQSFTIITSAPKNSEIYKNLDILYNSGAKFGEEKGKHLSIPDFTKMETNKEFLEIIEKIIDNPMNANIKIKSLEEKLGSYVFNADNFFKMVQILLRLRAGIPVLIMGETGCGKTSLIKAIATINNYKMITFNIHAGINDNEIVQFMKKNNLLENDIGYDEFEGDIERLIFDKNNEGSISNFNILNKNNDENEKMDINNEQLIIVFFDEFNTCNSSGLLTEIMCTKKCQGINVKKNVVFAGACNPYRKIDKKLEEKNKVANTALIKEASLNYNNKLVYAVNPLTNTQLYYIFNFGSLSAEIERKYITSIVNAEINDFIKDKSKLEKIKELMIESFMQAQIFVKEKNGKESVSMRETRKFIIIYKFLIKDFNRKIQLSKKYYQNERNEVKTENLCYKFYLDKDEDELAQKYCIATTIYICFYIRLHDSNDKLEFTKLMNKIFSLDFASYPKQLEDELISNIKLVKGIAPNESLRLNLLILFIGIMTRIAVFLVGPPGCSKTLCFNILKKEMLGHQSKSEFWKEYPKLLVISYQGSLTSTSKGIIDSFKEGEKILAEFIEKKEKVIICVFIDEIGLCEISPSNPLKALHTYLELDYKSKNLKNSDEKLAFVGISNWRLDAAKMNRGIFLNVINPISNIEQMNNTACYITDEFDITFSKKYKELLNNLCKIIYNYNIYLKDINAEFINFHGTRDFYNLIKTTAKKIIEKTNKDEIESALFSIECNYNGIIRNSVDSAEYIKKKFKELYPNFEGKDKFGIVECIKNNIIEEEDNRYLLLIMKSNLSQYLILNILKDFKDEEKIVYFLGSLFEEDIYNEAYSAKAINKIQYYLEQDIILILKNLSTTYSSLYDLFNQRFILIRNKKYTEISLGEVTNSAFVNDNLKIIVFIREEAVKMQDPPFLNRFEKYYISFDNLLDDETRPIAKKILDYRDMFKNSNNKIKLHFDNELINLYDEEIKSIIVDYKINLEKNQAFKEDIIIDHVLEKIARTMPQELIVFLNHYKMKNNKDVVEKINHFYSKTVHTNIQSYIEKCRNHIGIIYTFTPSVRSNNFSANNKLLGNIDSKNIKIININLIKTEHQLEMDMSDFYDSNELKLLFIKFDEKDAQNLEFVLMFLKRFQKEKNNKNKIIIVLIHLSRKNQGFNKDIFVPSLSGFEQTFIDNLNGKNIIISDILNRNLIELYNNKALINLNEFFQNELYNCFKKINYTFDDKSIKESEYIGNVINYILSDEKLKKKITDIILKGIEKYKKNEKNKEKNSEKKSWNIYDYIFENEISEKNEDFISIFISTLEKVFISFLSILLIEAEKSSIFSSFIYKKNLPENAKSMWEGILDEINFSDKVVIEFKNILKQTNIKINTKMNLPSFEFIKSLKNLLQKDNIKEYFEAENEIRNCREPGDFIKDNEDDMENEEYEENEEIKEKKKLINEFFYENVNDINDEKYESVKEDINKFYVPNNKLVNDIKQFIDKDEFVKKLKKINDINFLKVFIEDYYYIHQLIVLFYKNFLK